METQEGVKAAGYSLLLIQTFAAFIWTYAASTPAWFAVTSGLWAVVSAMALSATTVLLGAYRYNVHGEVRKREFGVVPYFIRSIILAAPSHALHGAVVSLFVVTWMTYDPETLQGDEDEKDEQLRRAFFCSFMQGWLFSSMFLIQKRQQLFFERANHKTRLNILMEKAPRIGFNIVVLNLLGILLNEWTPLWICVSFTLELSDAILGTILSERARAKDIDEGLLSRAASSVPHKSVEELFRAFPLLVTNTSKDTSSQSSSGLLSMIPKKGDDEAVQEWWNSKRSFLGQESSLTGVNAASILVNLSEDRFNTVSQLVYRCDALDEGSAFAKCTQSLGFATETLRIRALSTVSMNEISFTNRLEDWTIALDACLNILDGQALRLLAFVKVASPKMEPPRNPETGLDDTDAFQPKSSTRETDDIEDRRRKARDLRWNLDHKRFVGKSWLKRLVLGNLLWDFDPIYEEARRRRGLVDEDSPTWVRRDVDAALMADFHVVCRASEAAVCLVKKKKPASLPSLEHGKIVALVQSTLDRCLSAGDQALKVMEDSKLAYQQLYAFLFCVERDLQQLKG